MDLATLVVVGVGGLPLVVVCVLWLLDRQHRRAVWRHLTSMGWSPSGGVLTSLGYVVEPCRHGWHVRQERGGASWIVWTTRGTDPLEVAFRVNGVAVQAFVDERKSWDGEAT